MVTEQLIARQVKDRAILDAMRKVPRHEFVPPQLQDAAYSDGPLPIGYEQTISQPFIVAVMTQLLRVNKTGKVLEVGTGSGYQTAVLCELADFVYTTEIIEPLGLKADETLRRLGYKNFELRIGDGYGGWEENAPFDGIILTAAPDHIPQPLVRQLKSGARLILPVGGNIQELTVITKTGEGLITEKILPVKFVRMTGEAEESSSL